MSSTCFESEDSSSGGRLCVQLWYGTFDIHQYKQSSRQKGVFDCFYDACKIYRTTTPHTKVFLKMKPRVRNM